MVEINNYPNYLISSTGIIIRKEPLKEIKGSVGSKYRVVALKNSQGKKRFSVHHLVAEHFLKQQKKTGYINFKDGNRANTDCQNLEYCRFGIFLDKSKKRKKICFKKSFKRRLPPKMLLSYYIDVVPTKLKPAVACIYSIRPYDIEKMVASALGLLNSNSHSIDDKIFFDYCEGIKFIDLMVKYDKSPKYLTAMFYKLRMKFIEAIELRRKYGIDKL